MTEATILTFPVRPKPQGERERLRRALTDLQDAVAEQKAALGAWRFAMAELGIGVAGLGQSLISYQDGLAGVKQQLGDLRMASVRLQHTAALAAAQADVT